MTTVRSAKVKGSALEYDTHYSLKQCYPDVLLTKQLGFQMQYDIKSDNAKIAVECKRLKGISWNQLVGFYQKLKEAAPAGYECYVVFQSNHQPCLVFNVDLNFGEASIRQFIDVFGVPFLKHPSTRKKVNENVDKMEDKKAEETVKPTE